jgi:hypothetical protein
MPDGVIERLDNISKRRAFRRAKTESIKLDRILKLQGVEPPKAQPGALSSFLDTLDTGGQLARGVIAKTIGTEGFENESVIGAARKANKENLTVSEILRREGILQDSPITRGVVGFIGDVATDPVTYLTFGGGAGAKLGGKTLNLAADVATKGGDKVKVAQLLQKSSKNLVEKNLDELRRSKGVTSLSKDDILKAQTKAQVQLSKAGNELSSVIDRGKKLNRAGADDIIQLGGKEADQTAKALADQQIAREKRIRDVFDLADDQALEDIFKPGAIRISSPFAGLISGPTAAKIPLFSRSADIPFLTKGSTAAYRYLNGKSYNAKVVVGDVTEDVLKRFENSGSGLLQAVASTARAGGKVPGLLSKRIRAGGKAEKIAIEEHQIAREVTKDMVKADYQPAFDLFEELAEKAGRDPEELYSRITHAFQDALRPTNFRKDTLQEVATKGTLKAGDFAIDDKVLNTTLTNLKREFNAIEAGLGDEALNILKFARDEFDNLLDVDTAAGVLTQAINDYIPNAYIQAKGIDAVGQAERVAKSVLGKKPDFTLKREFASMNLAQLQLGLKPKASIKDRLITRRIASLKARGEKDFYERLGFEFGMDANFKAQLEKNLLSERKEIVEATVKFLERSGFDLQPFAAQAQKKIGTTQSGLKALAKSGGDESADVLKAVEANPNLKLVDDTGTFIDSQRLEFLRERANNPNAYKADSARAAQMLEKAGLSTKPDNVLDPVIEKLSVLKDRYAATLTGREGESLYGRAATTLIREDYKNFILKNSKDEDLKRFVSGVLPESLVKAVNETFQQRDLLQLTVGQLRNTGHTDIAEFLERSIGSMIGVVNNLKFGVTQFWPAFHMRNLGSAQFLATQEASIIGEALNPVQMAKVMALKKGRGRVVSETGEVIQAQQLYREMNELGVINKNPLSHVEMAKAYEGVLQKLAKNTKAGQVFSNFSNSVENFGREFLYTQLRKQGFDAGTAAARTRQIMVDYTRGKTPFERDILNNVIFFYSFARTNTANHIRALLSKPGALTNQLHAFNSVKSMLGGVNPGPITDVEREYMSLRGSEKLVSGIGRKDEDGNPLILENVGLPIEDVSRFLPLKVPENPTNLNDIFNAASQTTRRFGQLMVASSNPIVRSIAEHIADRDFFFDRPLSDEALRKFPLWEKDLANVGSDNVIPEQVYDGFNAVTKAALGGYEDGKGNIIADPVRFTLLKALVPGFSRFASTSNFLSKEEVAPEFKALRLLSGVKVAPGNVEKSLIFDDVRRKKEFAKRRGLATNRKQLRRRRLIERRS